LTGGRIQARPAPIEAAFTLRDDAVAMAVSLDGRPTVTLALSTLLPHTFVLKGIPLTAADVSVDGKKFGRTDVFVPSVKLEENVEGVLGLDVLRETAVGLDMTTGRITIWPGGDLPEAEARLWTAAYRQNDPARVTTIPLGRSNGAFTVPVQWGDRKGRGLVVLAMNRTTFGDTSTGPERTSILTSNPETAPQFTPEVYVADRLSPWQVVSVGPDPTWQEHPAEASVTLDALRSRRILLDFKGGRMFVELLSADERLSLALMSFLHFPCSIEGNHLWLDDIPGGPGDVVKASEILQVQGLPSSFLLRSLRTRDKDAVTRMAALFGAARFGYDLKIRLPDGTEQLVRAKPPRGE
jgi:hypothetical protein